MNWSKSIEKCTYEYWCCLWISWYVDPKNKEEKNDQNFRYSYTRMPEFYYIASLVLSSSFITFSKVFSYIQNWTNKQFDVFSVAQYNSGNVMNSKRVYYFQDNSTICHKYSVIRISQIMKSNFLFRTKMLRRYHEKKVDVILQILLELKISFLSSACNARRIWKIDVKWILQRAGFL